jgi:hypothetical protein
MGTPCHGLLDVACATGRHLYRLENLRASGHTVTAALNGDTIKRTLQFCVCLKRVSETRRHCVRKRACVCVCKSSFLGRDPKGVFQENSSRVLPLI